MTEKTPQKDWQQYFDNSKKNIKVELEPAEDEKARTELFSEAQTFEDILAAVEAGGEIRDGAKTYTPDQLRAILENAKKSRDLSCVPAVLGLESAAKNALEAIVQEEYQNNLKNLFEEFKILLEAKDFNAVFGKSEIEDEDVDIKEREIKLGDEYDRISKLFKSKKITNPADGKISVEVRQIAEKAKLMLEAYRTKAENFLGNQKVKKSKEEIEEKLDPVNINNSINRSELVEVKIKRSSGVTEEDWHVTEINGNDVVVVKIDDTGASITKTVKLDELKQWNIETFTAKNVVDPKVGKKNKEELEEKKAVVDKIEAELNTKKIEEKKQTDEKRKNFEAKKGEVEKNNKGKVKTANELELVARHMEIAKTIEELDACRKEYLEKDYDKTAKLVKIGNFFKDFRDDFREKKDGTAEYAERVKISKNDPEILAFKKIYDDKLLELQSLILDDAQARGLSNEELAKLYASFRIEQKITLADEHDKVKVDKMTGTGYGWVKKATVDMVDGYQKLHWTKKIAIGVVFVGVGALSVSTASVFATTAAGLIAARRVFGGVMVGIGAKRGLEVRGQAKDQAEIEREQQKIFEELEKIKEQNDKYQQLSTKFDEIMTKDGHNALNKIKNQDIRQNFAAAAAGIFVGSGFAGQLIKDGFHGVVDYFSGHGGASGHIGATGEIPAAAQPGGSEVSGGVHGADAAEAPTSAAAEKWTINNGSSIEGTLRDHIRATHPEIKNLGKLDHDLWKNYMDGHKAEIIGKVGQDEYAKMLKDGMVNVKPGTIISIDNSDPDPSKWKITGIGNEGIDNDFSHLNVHEQVAANADAAPHPADVAAQAAADPAVAAEVATTAANHANASAEFAGNLVDNHSGATLNENFVQYAPEHSDVPDLSGSLVQEDAPVEVKSNIINFNLAIQNGIDRSFYQSHGHGHFRPFLERHGRFFEQHDHQGALRALRQTMIRDGGAWRQHRTANVLDLMKNNKQIFSSEGKKMMAELIKSEDFKPNGKIISLEEYTRGIVKKMAA